MIGKTIKSILTTNSPLIAVVPAVDIYPYVMNENTELPAIVYTINSVAPEYNKGGWCGDVIEFSVFAFANDYTTLQNISVLIRDALELTHTGYGTQEIGRIYLSAVAEGYDLANDAFFNKQNFNVKINKY